MTFEEKLDFLFEHTIVIDDTIWYSNGETLRDAVLRIYGESIDELLCVQ